MDTRNDTHAEYNKKVCSRQTKGTNIEHTPSIYLSVHSGHRISVISEVSHQETAFSETSRPAERPQGSLERAHHVAAVADGSFRQRLALFPWQGAIQPSLCRLSGGGLGSRATGVGGTGVPWYTAQVDSTRAFLVAALFLGPLLVRGRKQPPTVNATTSTSRAVKHYFAHRAAKHQSSNTRPKTRTSPTQ